MPFTRLGLVLALMLVTTRSDAQVADHLECYKVKDSAPKTSYTADLAGLAPEPGCLIKLPAKVLCVETTKTNLSSPPPISGNGPSAGRFLCYQLKCPKATLTGLTVRDQFGERLVQPAPARTLCAPLLPPADCGNGSVESGEACDDGNTVTETSCGYGVASCTACDATCSTVLNLTGAYCGDGVVNGPEACDDGNNVTESCPYGVATCTVCAANCTVVGAVGSYCGDGLVDTSAGESCDDGNQRNGDGCSATCQIE